MEIIIFKSAQQKTLVILVATFRMHGIIPSTKYSANRPSHHHSHTEREGDDEPRDGSTSSMYRRGTWGFGDVVSGDGVPMDFSPKNGPLFNSEVPKMIENPCQISDTACSTFGNFRCLADQIMIQILVVRCRNAEGFNHLRLAFFRLKDVRPP